mmetsp:Transcript_19156/g.31775  ORF Transcript_19156/g.31775 Transcript_19156/m.31775 type:complete len:512 (+) Transcript_19156:30-1565(+)|eukprot:CAMPEP_0119003504 /NCGR_PEP_ID=MMETSP1176-20130426/600_1 /TAXON_ID=265551 /ORGANISM="Synedropsis recta cf, Strain CCMP1620" /LENGTH=511 /DNA_ID=CAMNT_0006955115 /DNA_START=29 /DNA_END=1564 /DNA_ORIENTATION=+
MTTTRRRCKRSCIAGDSADDDEAPADEIELQLQLQPAMVVVLDDKKKEATPLLIRVREQRTTNEALVVSRGQTFLYAVRNWTAAYAVLFVLIVVFFESADSVTILMRWFGSMVAWCMILSNFSECRDIVCRRRLPTVTYGFMYGFCLSLLVSSSNDVIRPSNVYARIFHWAKPCHKIEQIMQALRYDTKLPENLSYIDRECPLQAMGLDNWYMRQFKEALEVHFDRYARNETERFAYVTTINLIGNVFDDTGAAYLCQALEHQHAYTTNLLLGRNQNLGDKTASLLATLIRRQPSSPAALTWLEFGGTSVTAGGLTQLYAAMGTRSFDYLGLEYTDKRLIQRVPWIFTPNPIPKSLSQLHQAKLLKHVDLTGNMLDDNNMAELTENVQQTNITKLGLVNNKIGFRGVEFLLPLTKQLTELQLGINRRINDDSAILLADALKEDPATTTLELLMLWNCRIGQKGADAFLSIFPENTKLKYLSLESSTRRIGKHIQKETLQALDKATIANYKS